ncbi:lipid asymmetry maintenance protein MlaB [Streptomyces sp. NPDC056470]|uniref:STAS domain-containing protein n=1 Tax=Streptomyces sp. NPDC056470 TaxID=3345831 RepID=UPI0036B23C94
MSAHVLVIRDNHQAVAYVSGELDIATAPATHSSTPSTTTSRSPSTWTGSTCDCASLSALITVYKTARAQGTTLTIRNIPHQLTRLLRHVPPHPAHRTEQATQHACSPIPHRQRVTQPCPGSLRAQAQRR